MIRMILIHPRDIKPKRDNAIDLKINGYRKVQKDFGDAIMKTLELTPIQVSKIPPK